MHIEKTKTINEVSEIQSKIENTKNKVENKVKNKVENSVEKSKSSDSGDSNENSESQKTKGTDVNLDKNNEIKISDNTVSGNIVISDDSAGPMDGNEVFHIGKNDFSYEEAHAVCQTLGSRLATEDQLKNAWKNGANWCNYGWTQGQKTMFPIQKDYWNARNCLKPKGQPNPCGEIGVNGGYQPSPHLKLGVNCYGKKPERTDEQIARERKWLEEKDKYDATSYGKLSKEELDRIRNKRYKKILAGMRKDILVNEVKEFNNLKLKWSKYNQNNVLPSPK